MTPFVEPSNPLSLTTVMAFADLGYRVDTLEADTFFSTSSSAQAQAEDDERRIPLREIFIGPLLELDEEGFARPAPAGGTPPFQAKEDARDMLRASFPTGDWRSDLRLKWAIHSLDMSLQERLWETDRTLTRRGQRVFIWERLAVRQLMKMVDEQRTPSLDARSVIERLVRADARLAQETINQAAAVGGDSNRLQKAYGLMLEAHEQAERGDFGDAISSYRMAWKNAMRAAN